MGFQHTGHPSRQPACAMLPAGHAQKKVAALALMGGIVSRCCGRSAARHFSDSPRWPFTAGRRGLRAVYLAHQLDKVFWAASAC